MTPDIQFYTLSPAVDTTETGHAYPVVESPQGYDFNAGNSAHTLTYGAFPESNPDLRFHLAEGARLCDMMGQATISAHGFLISQKLKNILGTFNLVPHRFYPAPIESKGKTYSYFWLHLVWNDAEKHVDYKNSDFYVRRFSKNLGKIEVKHESDILEKRKALDIASRIDFEQIILTDVPPEMFLLNYFTDIYITEKLKAGLQKEELTGIQITKTGKLHVALQP
jgi:hypothetical protein